MGLGVGFFFISLSDKTLTSHYCPQMSTLRNSVATRVTVGSSFAEKNDISKAPNPVVDTRF